MGASILERELKGRKDIKELMESLDEMDKFADSLKSKYDDDTNQILDAWKKFVKYIKEDIPFNLKQHVLNTVPHVTTLLSELKNRSDVKKGALSKECLSKRVNGWDSHSFITSRLIDISLKLGADINSTYAGIPFKSMGMPAIHFAAYMNNYNCQSTFVNRWAAIDNSCKKENHPLHYAFMNNRDLTLKKKTPNYELLKEYYRLNATKTQTQIIEKTKNVNIQGKNGNSVLHIIAKQKQIENTKSIDLLFEKGLDVNQKNNKGLAPLHVATISSSFKAINLLSERNANFNIQDKQGRTPLHYAYMYDRELLAKELIKLGCNPNAKDKFGKKPIDYLEREDIFILKPRKNDGLTLA